VSKQEISGNIFVNIEDRSQNFLLYLFLLYEKNLTWRTPLRTFVKNISRCSMPTLSATDARAKLYRLIDQTHSSHEPIVITGKRGNAVLISEDDWRAVQETLYLLNIPGMKESIKEGLATPIDKCDEEIDW
jgi:prevent-host-death family protein